MTLRVCSDVQSYVNITLGWLSEATDDISWFNDMFNPSFPDMILENPSS